ncbi:MAG: serine--tRNA ligase [Patescibacteria group bacterium]|nr:serine--tRNA ligase [Patescibacteria group bacterium]
MIDIKFIRENPKLVKDGASSKGVSINIDEILKKDEQYRECASKAQKLQEKKNALSGTLKGKPTPEQLLKGKEIKEALQKTEIDLKQCEDNLRMVLSQIPNLPKKDVKVGKDETENEVIKKYKEPPKFIFTPKDHLELGEKLDIIDVERASKVSGARFAYLKNDGVLLELALVNLAMKTLIKEGFVPVIPQTLIKKEAMQGLGYMENGGEEDMYHLEKDDLYLVATAEHSIVPMHMGEVFKKKDLPRRYVAFSSAFRREAGSYGKDTRGILRVHQFDKVEMVSYVPQGEDDKEHEYLLFWEEKLFQLLEIPYQVVKMCTGDLGFPAARKFDIEAWMPGQNKYREVTSVSTVTDFQARRLNIKYQDGSEKHYVNILNGTAFAIGRTIIAILENYQKEDGSVEIPKVLQKTLGKSVIKSIK